MTSFFWTGGRMAYAVGLKEHYELRMRELRARLERCDDPSEYDATEREINEARAELIAKLEEIDQLLF